ncbi:MAG: SAM-dependent chlorinase/fluorinase [Bacteroidota bacterium]
MQIITLTSDLGLKDHYVASLKAMILQLSPSVTIVDISHQVLPFNVIQASHLIKFCFEDFPLGTIHVIGVNDEPEIDAPENQQMVPAIIFFKGHYFISNDNGFFGALVGEDEHEGFYRLTDALSNPKNISSPTRNMLIPAACKIANGERIEDIGYEFSSFRNAFISVPITEPNLILGHIIYIDLYGNLITNIHKSLFDEIGKGNEFTIYIRNKDYHISEISSTYNAVPTGQSVAVFNKNNYIEIAINKGANATHGGAEKLMGMKLDDMVRILFTSRGSHVKIDDLFV